MGKRSRTLEKSEERSGMHLLVVYSVTQLCSTPVATADGLLNAGTQEALCKKLPRIVQKQAYQIIPKRLHGDMLITVCPAHIALPTLC
jgi:hypothetical protein